MGVGWELKVFLKKIVPLIDIIHPVYFIDTFGALSSLRTRQKLSVPGRYKMLLAVVRLMA